MPADAPQFDSNIFRYAVATIGPVGSAGAQFLLAFVLLRILDPQAFGRFSFLLILSQFSWGVWSALFCASLPILHQGSGGDRAVRIDAMFAANLLGVVIAFFLFVGIALALGETWLAALLYAAYAAIALLRWFARAGAYAVGEPLRTTASDIVYTVVLLAGASTLFFWKEQAVTLVWASLFAGVLIGLLPFGARYFRQQFCISLRRLPAYAATWRDHGRWALLGVLTTEMTANAHSYLVTFILGPTAFAPIAASALMIRPITVAMNALIEFERARMARDIGGGNIGGALQAVRFFRYALGAVWIGSAVSATLLFWWNPRLVFPAKYAVETMAVATALWLVTAGIRVLRAPESAMLQAAGAFRPLAFASIWSSVVSVAVVLAMIAAIGPVGSIGGIILGECMFALATWKTLRTWLGGRGHLVHAEG